jgi:hypothetical protein
MMHVALAGEDLDHENGALHSFSLSVRTALSVSSPFPCQCHPLSFAAFSAAQYARHTFVF